MQKPIVNTVSAPLIADEWKEATEINAVSAAKHESAMPVQTLGNFEARDVLCPRSTTEAQMNKDTIAGGASRAAITDLAALASPNTRKGKQLAMNTNHGLL